MKKQATAAGARAEVLLERGLRFAVTAALVVVGISIGADVRAQPAGGVLNLYSARHYQTDEALYDNFTKQTGIKINRIEARRRAAARAHPKTKARTARPTC